MTVVPAEHSLRPLSQAHGRHGAWGRRLLWGHCQPPEVSCNLGKKSSPSRENGPHSTRSCFQHFPSTDPRLRLLYSPKGSCLAKVGVGASGMKNLEEASCVWNPMKRTLAPNVLLKPGLPPDQVHTAQLFDAPSKAPSSSRFPFSVPAPACCSRARTLYT